MWSSMLLIVKNYKQHLIVFTNQTNFSTVCLQMLICIQIVLVLETKNKVQQLLKSFEFWKMLTLSMPKVTSLEMLMSIWLVNLLLKLVKKLENSIRHMDQLNFWHVLPLWGKKIKKVCKFMIHVWGQVLYFWVVRTILMSLDISSIMVKN